jgi:hypothetical protein
MEMTSQIKPKKARKVRKGAGSFVGCQMSREMIDAIDLWATERGMSRSEAIRRMLEQAIAISRPTTKGSRAKASELAAKEIDKLRNSSVSDEERQQRKSRLLKGPREFRDIRGDRSKAEE